MLSLKTQKNNVLNQILNLVLVVFISLFSFQQACANDNAMKQVVEETGEFSCLSEKEAKLFQIINEYRESHGLPPIANSRSMNKVARLHVIDLVENKPADGEDSRGLSCSLHSWSNKGLWRSVCYTKDHAYADAMWDKPREITNYAYSGDGYENAYATTDESVTPEKVLEAWKKSPSHNAIMLEKEMWKGSNLLALGVGIYKNHAVIWVGSLIDPLGALPVCKSTI